MENNTKGEVVYNQAALQQQRINELYSRIDDNSINLFELNFQKKTMGVDIMNYQIIVNDLNSLFLTICSKLDEKERSDIKEMRVKIRNLLRTNPPFSIKCTAMGKKVTLIDEKNQDLIADTIQDYRMLIEFAMEKHGFSNPNKEDVTKSVVNM